jgi:hypothetical protein
MQCGDDTPSLPATAGADDGGFCDRAGRAKATVRANASVASGAEEIRGSGMGGSLLDT